MERSTTINVQQAAAGKEMCPRERATAPKSYLAETRGPREVKKFRSHSAAGTVGAVQVPLRSVVDRWCDECVSD